MKPSRKIRTHYDNLKVARDAPLEVVRAAYRSLAQKHHPDRNPGDADATRKLAILNASFEVLSDSERRAAHDRWIEETERENTSTPESLVSTPPPPSPELGASRAGKLLSRVLRSGTTWCFIAGAALGLFPRMYPDEARWFRASVERIYDEHFGTGSSKHHVRLPRGEAAKLQVISWQFQNRVNGRAVVVEAHSKTDWTITSLRLKITDPLQGTREFLLGVMDGVRQRALMPHGIATFTAETGDFGMGQNQTGQITEVYGFKE